MKYGVPRLEKLYFYFILTLFVIELQQSVDNISVWSWPLDSKSKSGSRGGVVVISSWLAEQEVRSSIPGHAATISEIGYFLHPSRDMAEI